MRNGLNIEKREIRVKLKNNVLVTNQIISDTLRFGWNEFQFLLLSVVDTLIGGNEFQSQLLSVMRWVAEDTSPQRRETIRECGAQLRVSRWLDEALHVVQILWKSASQSLRQTERRERREEEHNGKRRECEWRRDGEQQRREHRRRSSDARRNSERPRAPRRREELTFDQEDQVVGGGHE